MAVEYATMTGMEESLLLTATGLKAVLGPWLVGVLPGCYVGVRVDI